MGQRFSAFVEASFSTPRKRTIDEVADEFYEEEEDFRPSKRTKFAREQGIAEDLIEWESNVTVDSQEDNSLFGGLPVELQLLIFSHLEAKDLCRCAVVCLHLIISYVIFNLFISNHFQGIQEME